jgi:protein-S-isoprenylcysteine O-methyltransferase Ste14
MIISWAALALFWIVSGIRAKKSSFKENNLRQFIYYWLPLIIAAYLLGPDERFGNSLITGHFLPHTDIVGIIGLVFSISGLVTACWARLLLGKNWSVSVQQKQDHELVNSGVYRFVRHPIYTGLLMMLAGNVIINGNWRGILAFLIVFVSFWFKMNKEEKWLIKMFGDKYIDYMKDTKKLIPWIL